MRRIIFGLLITAMCAPILWWSMKMRGRNEACDAWPTVQAEVLRSGTVRDSSRIRGGGYNKFLRQDILYRYTVGEKTYESSTITFGQSTTVNEGDALPAVGSRIDVHYDPADPASSCLTGGEPGGTNLLVYMTGAFLLAGIISIISGLMGRRNKRA